MFSLEGWKGFHSWELEALRGSVRGGVSSSGVGWLEMFFPGVWEALLRSGDYLVDVLPMNVFPSCIGDGFLTRIRWRLGNVVFSMPWRGI